MNRSMTALRWVAVLPAFLLTAFAVGCGIIFLVYATSSLAIFKWFMIPADEYIGFWRASDMNGSFLSGSIWLLMTYGLAFSVGISAAIRVAPDHPMQTAYVLTGIVAGVLLTSFALSLSQPLSFSGWYRSLAEAACILIGCSAGLYEAAKQSDCTLK